jgi:hypothetical protein
MNRIKELCEQDRFYWICVVITTVLSYGFTLTNVSITADDEAFEMFVQEGLLLAEGRWGHLPIQRIFNSYIFLPFWREFIALMFMVAGLTLICGLFRKYSQGKFDGKASTIFSCVAISFPITAHIFSFMLATLELGLSLVLVGLALLFFARWAIDRGKIYQGIFSALILGYGIAFRETAIIFFMVSGFSLLLLVFMYGKNKEIYKLKLFLLIILKMAGVLIGTVVTWFLGVLLFRLLLSTESVGYTFGMIRHDTTGVFPFLGSVFRFMFSLPMVLIGDASSLVAWLLIGISLALTGVGIVYGVKLRQVSVFITAVCLIISSYSMYIILGWTYPYNRIQTPFMILVGFTVALGYIISTQLEWKKVKLKYLMIFVSIWLVFYGSRMMNQVFYLDYLTYRKDVLVMETVIHDLNGLQDSYPILFIGLLPQQLPLDEKSGYSIFNSGRRGTLYAELTVRRAHRFFEMHGFPIDYIIGGIDVYQVMYYVADMENWPKEGYIRQTENFVIVKLGHSSIEQFID